MADYLATVTFEHDSGLAENRVVNTFAFGNVDAGQPARTDLMVALIAFYNSVPTGGVDYLARYLSPELSVASDASVIRFYDVSTELDGGNHGSPVDDVTFTLAAPFVGTDAMPSEIAHCVTLNAVGRSEAPVEAPDGSDPGVEIDRPKMRHTGRIYVGPLNNAAKTSTVPNPARPSSGLRGVISLAADDLATAADLVSGVGGGWCVWSRKDAVMRRIISISQDDAFDVQRRRGVKATSRTTTNVG